MRPKVAFLTWAARCVLFSGHPPPEIPPSSWLAFPLPKRVAFVSLALNSPLFPLPPPPSRVCLSLLLPSEVLRLDLRAISFFLWVSYIPAFSTENLFLGSCALIASFLFILLHSYFFLSSISYRIVRPIHIHHPLMIGWKSIVSPCPLSSLYL